MQARDPQPFETITFLTEQAGLEAVVHKMLGHAGVIYEPVGPASNYQTEAEREIDQIDRLLRGSEQIREPHEIVPIDDVGYVIRFNALPTSSERPWLMADFDDFMIATTEAKSRMATAYGLYLEQTDLSLSGAVQKRAIAIADGFARREGTYHLVPNVFALAWTTEQLRALPGLPGTVLDHAEQELADIKSGLSRARQPKATVSDDFLKVFMPIIRPQTFVDFTEVINQVGPTGMAEANTALFTYGQPFFQLVKLAATMAEQARTGSHLQHSQIWLTKIKKGDFLQRVAEKFGTTDPAAAIAAELVQSPALLLADDDPAQLNSFLQTDIPVNRGALRSVRQGTKTVDRQWIFGVEPPAAMVHDADKEDAASFKAKITQILGHLTGLAVQPESQSTDHQAA
jgi:hypothetical protein